MSDANGGGASAAIAVGGLAN